jgi:hypothetical protein
MESAVARLLVFMATVRTEGEFSHCRVGAFERHRVDHRIPRAALSAACERVSVASVVAAGDFAGAIRAKAAILWNASDERARRQLFDNRKTPAPT